LNIAEQPVHDIYKVRELGKKRSPVEMFVTVPTVFEIVSLIAIPVAVDLYHIQPAQLSALHQFLYPDRRGRIAVLHHTEYIPALLQSCENDLFRIGFCKGYGLFNHDMAPRIECLQSDLRMVAIGRSYADYI